MTDHAELIERLTRENADLRAEVERLREAGIRARKWFKSRGLVDGYAYRALGDALDQEEWREIQQHVQPRISDGYTDVKMSKPGYWLVKGPGPALGHTQGGDKP